MNVDTRFRFNEAMWSAVTEGYEKGLSFRNLRMRFRRAMEVMGMFWFDTIAWWFEGRYYVPVFTKEIRSAISWCLDRAEVDATVKLIKDITWHCRLTLESLERTSTDYSYISLRNGVLDMDKDRLSLLPHTRDLFITRYFDFDYDPAARCPLWHQFLDEVLPEKASQDVLQEFLGAVFLNRERYKIEVMLWLFGDGANGKSVVFNTVVSVLGKENISARDMRELLNWQRGSFALSDIEGKLLNYCSDIQGEFVFTDTAKKIISGEPLHAERKFENARLVTRIPLMMANTNTLPKLADKTLSWARRVKIIPFNVTIPEERQDKGLSRKLESERSGIFTWFLEGRRRFLRQGCKFSECPQGDLLMYKYRTSGYDVLDFMQAEGLSCIRYNVGDEGKAILTRDLYRVFTSWLEVEGAPEYARISLPKFRDRLRRYGYIPFHTAGGSTIRAFTMRTVKGEAVQQKKIDAVPELTVKEVALPAVEGDLEGRGAVLDRIRKDMEGEL